MVLKKEWKLKMVAPYWRDEEKEVVKKFLLS